MNKNMILAIAALVIIYLLFRNKKVGETLRDIATGAIPMGLTGTNMPRTETASTTIPPASPGEGAPIVVNGNGTTVDLGVDTYNDINVSGTFNLPQ